MYADRLPSTSSRTTQNESPNKDTKREPGLTANLKQHMWTRLRRILAKTTSHYRTNNMHPPKSPVEENKRLR
jgi:hypothetical protein